MQALEDRAVKQAHMGQAVDGEDGARPGLMQVSQGDGKAGVPVVAMQHIGAPVQARLPGGDGRGQPAEQRETVGIVRPGLAVRVVVGIAGALGKQRVFQQPGLCLCAGQPGRQNTQRHAVEGHLRHQCRRLD